MLINPTDSVGVQGAVETAKKAGVEVVAVVAQANEPIDSFVGSKNYNSGYMAGEYLVKQINNTGKVAILDGMPVVSILQRVEGFTDAMENYSIIQIVDKQTGKQKRSIALDETLNMIQAGGPFKATGAQFPKDQVRIAFGIAMAKYWGSNVPKQIPVDDVLLDKGNSKHFPWYVESVCC